MAGYEILPEDEVVNVNDVLEDLQRRNDQTIDLIIHQWNIYDDGYRLFTRLHEDRKDREDMGMLGIAKLFRAKRDCCARLLIQIHEMGVQNDDKS